MLYTGTRLQKFGEQALCNEIMSSICNFVHTSKELYIFYVISRSDDGDLAPKL